LRDWRGEGKSCSSRQPRGRGSRGNFDGVQVERSLKGNRKRKEKSNRVTGVWESKCGGKSVRGEKTSQGERTKVKERDESFKEYEEKIRKKKKIARYTPLILWETEKIGGVLENQEKANADNTGPNKLRGP